MGDLRSRTGYVDGLRAIAVLAVVAYHGFLSAGDGASLPPVLASGHRGVDLFFAISGFCLTYQYLATACERGTIVVDYARFVIRRFSRIAPPYYAALALFAILAFTPFGLPTARPGVSVLSASVELPFDAIFLTSAVPSHDASFWTLGVEMRWYLLCPLLITLFVRSRHAFAAVLFGLWTLYNLTPWTVADFGMLPCFMLGIVAAQIAIDDRTNRLALLVVSVVVVVALASSAHAGAVDHGDPLWHAAAFLALVWAGRAPARRILAWAPLVAIGRASYAIYLVHEPFLAWFAAHGFGAVPSMLGGLAAGFAFWYGCERYIVRAPFRARIERTFDAALRLRATAA